jgi:hypothetical protein
VFELPGGWGVEPPQLFAQPPKQDALGYPGGGQFQPPLPLLMMLNCLCVMTVTMNRQMSTPPPTYFLTIQTLVSFHFLQQLLHKKPGSFTRKISSPNCCKKKISRSHCKASHYIMHMKCCMAAFINQNQSHLNGYLYSGRDGLETETSRDASMVSSRSRMGQDSKGLGLVSISEADVPGLVSVSGSNVSVSSRSRDFRSRAHPYITAVPQADSIKYGIGRLTNDVIVNIFQYILKLSSIQ